MALKLDSGFEILRYSDEKYEKLTVEIDYQGEIIAQINQDKGEIQLEIEIFTTDYLSNEFIPKFLLDDFIEALTKAKDYL